MPSNVWKRRTSGWWHRCVGGRPLFVDVALQQRARVQAHEQHNLLSAVCSGCCSPSSLSTHCRYARWPLRSRRQRLPTAARSAKQPASAPLQ